MHASGFYLFRIPLETYPGRSLLRRHFQGSVNAKRPELSLSLVTEAERCNLQEKKDNMHTDLWQLDLSTRLSSVIADAFIPATVCSQRIRSCVSIAGGCRSHFISQIEKHTYQCKWNECSGVSGWRDMRGRGWKFELCGERNMHFFSLNVVNFFVTQHGVTETACR